MMKRIALLALCVLLQGAALAGTAPFKVLTFNIRCGSCEQPDDINHWSRRGARVAQLLAQRAPDLIGLQEAELFQVRDLAAALKGYGVIAVGRDDGKQAGESTAILYRQERYTLLEQRTLWLSPTPEVVGKGWDAALNRTVSYARLRDKRNGKQLLMLNTHFDHKGPQAQAESSRLIVALAQRLGGADAVVVTGDFNYTRRSPAYPLIASVLHDAEQVTRTPAQGGDMSFNGFGTDIEPGNKIDFIFVNDQLEVQSHAILTQRDQGLYASDHYPVEAELRWP